MLARSIGGFAKIAGVLVCWSIPFQKTYSVPWLSVLTAQSWRPPIWPLLTACESCVVLQWSPPSEDALSTIGSGKPPRSWLRKAALQTSLSDSRVEVTKSVRFSVSTSG